MVWSCIRKSKGLGGNLWNCLHCLLSMWKDVTVAAGIFFTLFFPDSTFLVMLYLLNQDFDMLTFTQTQILKSLPYASISLSPHQLGTKSYLFCLLKSFHLSAPFTPLLQVFTISQLSLAAFQTGFLTLSLSSTSHSPNTDLGPN